jgi:hypothetical protein
MVTAKNWMILEYIERDWEIGARTVSLLMSGKARYRRFLFRVRKWVCEACAKRCALLRVAAGIRYTYTRIYRLAMELQAAQEEFLHTFANWF